jgi:hypothetical protein
MRRARVQYFVLVMYNNESNRSILAAAAAAAVAAVAEWRVAAEGNAVSVAVSEP